MSEIKIVDSFGDIEGSIADTLKKHKTIVVTRGLAKMMWESWNELFYWARERNADLKEHEHGWLLETFNA